ncbi:secreted protein [Melampsora americana]|nr:secreted protein [Melampsora americana]
MNHLHFFSIFLCLVGILAPVFTLPTTQDKAVINRLTKTFAAQLQAGNYQGLYDLMGAGARVTINNKLFHQTSQVSSRDAFAALFSAYKPFAPITLAKTDAPVYLSTANNFKVRVGAVLGLKVNPFKVPIRLESEFTFKTKTPQIYKVQSATLTIHLQGQ